jgi:hypothetical protein
LRGKSEGWNNFYFECESWWVDIWITGRIGIIEFENVKWKGIMQNQIYLFLGNDWTRTNY